MARASLFKSSLIYITSEKYEASLKWRKSIVWICDEFVFFYVFLRIDNLKFKSICY